MILNTLLNNNLKILLTKVLESVSVGLSLDDLLRALQASLNFNSNIDISTLTEEAIEHVLRTDPRNFAVEINTDKGVLWYQKLPDPIPKEIGIRKHNQWHKLEIIPSHNRLISYTLESAFVPRRHLRVLSNLDRTTSDLIHEHSRRNSEGSTFLRLDKAYPKKYSNKVRHK